MTRVAAFAMEAGPAIGKLVVTDDLAKPPRIEVCETHFDQQTGQDPNTAGLTGGDAVETLMGLIGQNANHASL